MQNSSEKYTQLYGNGPKWPIFGQKTPFLAIRDPRGPRWMVKVDQMLYHRKIVVGELPKMQNLPEKMHPVVWKWPQSDPFEAKKRSHFWPQMDKFGAISTPLGAFF